MATFPSINPTYGIQKRSAPFKRVVRFADGFEHRITFGLAENQNPKIFIFTFLHFLNKIFFFILPYLI